LSGFPYRRKKRRLRRWPGRGGGRGRRPRELAARRRTAAAVRRGILRPDRARRRWGWRSSEEVGHSRGRRGLVGPGSPTRALDRGRQLGHERQRPAESRCTGAAKATKRPDSYVISQHGYVRINDSIGKHRKTEWAWARTFQKGRSRRNERLVLVQHLGTVSWIEDTLRPDVKCDSGGTCPRCAAPFFITKTSAYVGI